jgi:Amt family ammonium transporter
VTQLIGVFAIGAFVFGVSLVVWGILAATIGIRPTQEEEMKGLDSAELGMDAYPEFTKSSQLV